jgi:hypothetical protein
MQVRIALAVGVSIILIGGATIYRSVIGVGPGKPQPSLVSVDRNYQGDEDYQRFLSEFFLDVGTSSAQQNTKLTATQALGQQLIFDYVELAASGQATEESILALADRYAASIPSLNRAPSINYFDLKVVASTQSNLETYATAMTKIHEDYARAIKRLSTSSDSFTLSPTMYSLAKTLSGSYSTIAIKLQDLPVPSILAPSHLGLVNSYYSSAAAMKAISETDIDATIGFAGIAAMEKNLSDIDLYLSEITRILTANGV